MARVGRTAQTTGQKMATAFRTPISRIRLLTRTVFNLKTAFAGLAIGLVARSFIQAASTAENYQVRLKVLLGSVEEGNRLFEDMAEFASGVSFQYEEIMGSATSLAGVMKEGVDEINAWMPMIADLAAVTGMSIQETTGQVIRMYSAGAASADMFRERGVLAMLGFTAGVSYSAEETRRIMFESWNKTGSQFKDASAGLAKTWDGLMSMLADKWFQFRNLVMKAGVYTELKEVLSKINEEFKNWIGNNEELINQKIPEYVDKIKSSTKKMWTALKDIWAFTERTPDILKYGIIGLVLGGRRGMVVGMTAFLANWANKLGKALGLASTGIIKMREVVAAGSLEELDALIARGERIMAERGRPRTYPIGERVPGRRRERPPGPEYIIDMDAILRQAMRDYDRYAELTSEFGQRQIEGRQEVEAKIFELTHDAVENRVEAARQEYLAYRAMGVSGIEPFTLYQTRLTQIAKDQATARVEAQQTAQDTLSNLTGQGIDMRREMADREYIENIQRGVDWVTAEEIKAERLKQIDRQLWASRAQAAQQGVGQLSSAAEALYNSGIARSRRMFRVMKALRIADTLINTAAGVMQALASWPPPISYALATTTAIMGAAQIAAILAQRFPAAQQGGIIRGSQQGQLVQVGERGTDEAIIPMRGGAVPVAFTGRGGGGGIVVNNYNTYRMEGNTFMDQATLRNSLSSIAVAAVQRDYYNDGSMRNLMGRGA